MDTFSIIFRNSLHGKVNLKFINHDALKNEKRSHITIKDCEGLVIDGEAEMGLLGAPRSRLLSLRTSVTTGSSR